MFDIRNLAKKMGASRDVSLVEELTRAGATDS
jgi:DNA-binding CsgD family transcriptional regulator